MSDPLLSSLCSICHVKPHNYRCPRCSTLTCSLPCIKRHKQWAECNGVRDPAVYIKQKDLATPKGIDHDYNYLTSIERELDHAERNAASRGVILVDDVRSREHRYEKGEKALEAALERCGVIVVRAPKGMSRSKLNATRITAKTRTLRWTVEWVQPDGSKVLGMCPETQPISEAYTAHLNWFNPDRPSKRQKSNQEATESTIPNLGPSQDSIEQLSFENITTTNSPSDVDPTESLLETSEAATLPDEDKPSVSERAGLTHSQLRKRRRKGQIERTTSKPKTRVALESEQQLKDWRKGIDLKRKAEVRGLENAVKAADPDEGLSKEQSGELKPSETGHIDLSVSETNGQHDGDNPGKSQQQIIPNDTTLLNPSQTPLPSSTPNPPPTPPLSFHLHHPSLPSRHPVLIPLAPSTTLSSALTNRLVLEFPTIYVLHQHPGEGLPEGFISEEEFFRMKVVGGKKGGIEVVVEEGGVGGGKEEGSWGGGVEEIRRGFNGDGAVDERRLIEVLGRDLEGGAGGVL